MTQHEADHSTRPPSSAGAGEGTGAGAPRGKRKPTKAAGNAAEATGSAAEKSESALGKPEVFKPERTHVLALILLSAIALLSIGWAPQYLAWLLIIPILVTWWIFKARTTVSDSGIDISYGFRRSKSLTWDKCAGVGFQRAQAFAADHNGRRYPLPGVTFNSVPRLARASRGRIPDALSAGRAAASGKVVVIHRDGQQVLMSKEEYNQLHSDTATSSSPHPQGDK